MWRGFSYLLKKDFRLMVSGRFFLLTLGSLILYSCYINFIYVKIDQDIYPVYLYDPLDRLEYQSEYLTASESREALEASCADGYSVGIDLSSDTCEIYMLSSGIETMDHYREAWAKAVLTGETGGQAEIIGENTKEMKNRREITAEFLFFELSAVGFLGLASMLFKEKQMGVIRVHGILPVSRAAFIVSKLALLLVSDLAFTAILTLANLGFPAGLSVLPGVFVQAGILSLLMALTGFFCAVRLAGFRQFSLFYLVLAIFITTPVFLAEQTGAAWQWIYYHPMFHMFHAMKSAYFGETAYHLPYYLICLGTLLLLFLLSCRTLSREMAKEG